MIKSLSKTLLGLKDNQREDKRKKVLNLYEYCKFLYENENFPAKTVKTLLCEILSNVSTSNYSNYDMINGQNQCFDNEFLYKIADFVLTKGGKSASID